MANKKAASGYFFPDILLKNRTISPGRTPGRSKAGAYMRHTNVAAISPSLPLGKLHDR
jgi:hypothetical protein